MLVFIPISERIYRLRKTFPFKSFNQHPIYRQMAEAWGGRLMQEAPTHGIDYWQVNLPAGLWLRFMQIRSSWSDLVRIGIFKKDNPSLPFTVGNIYTRFGDLTGMDIEEALHFAPPNATETQDPIQT